MRRLHLFGPILGWDLITSSRRARYFVVRAFYVAFLLFFLWSTYVTVFSRYRGGEYEVSIRQMAVFSSSFFAQFGACQITAVLLLTPAYVASSVTLEKERRTIEYLFATDLDNHEIIFGKFIARTLNVLLLVLAGVPIISMSTFFGGVSPDQLLQLLIITVATVISTASIGMLISVYSNRTRTALSNAYGAVVILLLIPWIVMGIGTGGIELLRYLSVSGVIVDPLDDAVANLWRWLQTCQPYFVYTISLQASGRGELFAMLSTMATVHSIVTIVCISISILRLRATYRSQASSAATKTPRFAWFRRKERKAVRPVGAFPMLWKEWYFDTSRAKSRRASLLRTLFFVLLVVPILSMMVGIGGRADLDEWLNVLLRSIGTILIATTYISIAMRSACSIGAERDRDTWLSLLSAPLTGRELLQGKFGGALKPLILYLVIFTPIWFICMLLGGISILALPILPVVYSAYGIFIAGLGTLQAIRQPTTGRAITMTFVICALLFGFGHIFGTVLLIPLTWLEIDSDIVMMTYICSLPWTVLIFAPFRFDDIDGFGSDLIPAVLFSTIFVIAFASIGWMLLEYAIRNFNRYTNRSDDSAKN